MTHNDPDTHRPRPRGRAQAPLTPDQRYAESADGDSRHAPIVQARMKPMGELTADRADRFEDELLAYAQELAEKHGLEGQVGQAIAGDMILNSQLRLTGIREKSINTGRRQEWRRWRQCLEGLVADGVVSKKVLRLLPKNPWK